MLYEPKLKPIFYILCVLLCALVVFGWYGVYFLNANEIMMEGEPISSDLKSFVTALFSVIVGSWTLSLFTVVRQAIRGYAFSLDETGICNTCMGIMVFSFIIIIPVSCIPYSAILYLSEKDGEPVVRVKKREVVLPFVLRPFVRSEYFFLYRLCGAKADELKGRLEKYL